MASEQAALMPEWLTQRAGLSPDRLAFLCGEEAWSFADLNRRVSGMALRLRDVGVAPGNLLAVLAGDGRALVQAIHAVPLAGGVLVPLNVRLTSEELSRQLSHCGAAHLLYDSDHTETAAQLASDTPSLRPTLLDQLVAIGSVSPETPGRIDLSALHSIIYTSGTSGRPKGVMLTYGNHFWSAIGSALKLGVAPNDRWLACMPLFHVGGLSIMLRSVIYGITVVVHEVFDPKRVNRAIEDDGITIVSVVPTMLRRMLEARGDRSYPESLRCVLVGGGPLPAALLEECLRRKLPIAPTYGLTEAASQVATKAPWESAPGGSVGRPLFPTEVCILDEDGNHHVEGSGEIAVRGPTVTPGYLNDSEGTTLAIDDGWLHTGDIGMLDASGNLHFVDRRDDLIVSGGENVSPAEVEEALRAHDAVDDAAVVGLPDEDWGHVVAAAVVPRAGTRVAQESLREFCRTKLAGYKVPRSIRIVDRLPRTASGKLIRRELLEDWPAGSSELQAP